MGNNEARTRDTERIASPSGARHPTKLVIRPTVLRHMQGQVLVDVGSHSFQKVHMAGQARIEFEVLANDFDILREGSKASTSQPSEIKGSKLCPTWEPTSIMRRRAD